MASPKTELLRRDTQLAARVLWNVDGKRGVRAVAVQTLRLPDATTHFKLGGVHVIGTWDCRHRFWDVGRAAAIRVLISTYRGSIRLHVWGFTVASDQVGLLQPSGVRELAAMRQEACLWIYQLTAVYFNTSYESWLDLSEISFLLKKELTNVLACSEENEMHNHPFPLHFSNQLVNCPSEGFEYAHCLFMILRLEVPL